MAILDIFSKRQKRVRGELPDVFVYDVLPSRLRVQIMYIIDDTLGGSGEFLIERNVADMYKYIVQAIRREHGLLCLVAEDTPGWNYLSRRDRTYYAELRTVLLLEEDIELCLDAIEVSFRQLMRLRGCSVTFGETTRQKGLMKQSMN